MLNSIRMTFVFKDAQTSFFQRESLNVIASLTSNWQTKLKFTGTLMEKASDWTLKMDHQNDRCRFWQDASVKMKWTVQNSQVGLIIVIKHYITWCTSCITQWVHQLKMWPTSRPKQITVHPNHTDWGLKKRTK